MSFLHEWDLEFPQIARPLGEITSDAEMQLKIIEKYVRQFQQTLDPEHDVGALLADFGQPVLMEVTEISCEPPHTMIFRGLKDGREATLIQNVSRLNFLLTTVPKEPEKSRNAIGFNVYRAE